MEGRQQALLHLFDLEGLGSHRGGLVYEVLVYGNFCEMKSEG